MFYIYCLFGINNEAQCVVLGAWMGVYMYVYGYVYACLFVVSSWLCKCSRCFGSNSVSSFGAHEIAFAILRAWLPPPWTDASHSAWLAWGASKLLMSSLPPCLHAAWHRTHSHVASMVSPGHLARPHHPSRCQWLLPPLPLRFVRSPKNGTRGKLGKSNK